MLQWAKLKTAQQQAQVIPCRAGILNAVVYANGDVSVCETHPPLANLRQKAFREIWYSEEAQKLRRCIHNKECWCTNEVFLWSSINYQPVQLARAIVGAEVWKKVEPLADSEKLKVLPETPQASASELKVLSSPLKIL